MLLWMSTVSTAHGAALQIVTEEYPPYNYAKDGKVLGVGTEVVQATLSELNMAVPISVYPWARAYQIALNEPNTLIYTISRTPERENLFKWVGVITPVDQCVFSLQGPNLAINGFDDLKRYEIGTVIDDVQEQYLIRHGFPISKIQSNTSHEANFKKLLKGRIDLWAVLELTAYYIVKCHNRDPGKTIQKVYCMKDLSVEGDFMAFSKNTPDDIVQRFRNALQQIKQKRIYSEIIQRYKSL